MSDQLQELQQVLKDSRQISYDESQTKQFLILPVLAAAGWNVFSKDQVWPELKVGKKKFDYTLCREKKQFEVIIEAKRLKSNLSEHKKQLLSYAFESGIPIAILTNGRIWWFFLSVIGDSWDNRFVCSLNITKPAQQKQLLALLSRDWVQSGQTYRKLKEQYHRAKKEFRSDRSAAEFLAQNCENHALMQPLIEAFAKTAGISTEQAKKKITEYFQQSWSASAARAQQLPMTSSIAHLLPARVLNVYGRRISIQETTNSGFAAAALICYAQYASKALAFSQTLKNILTEFYKTEVSTVKQLQQRHHLQLKITTTLLTQRLAFTPKSRYSDETLDRLFYRLNNINTSTNTTQKTEDRTKNKKRRL